MKIAEIDISKIVVGERLWEAREHKIPKLAESIKEVGLINPITVLKNGDEYILIAGEHRLKAFIYNGETVIPATVREREYEDLEQDKAKCLLLECDENMVRASPDGFEEGYILYQRKVAYEKLYPETTKEAKQSAAGLERVKSIPEISKASPNLGEAEDIKTFVEDTAEKLGMSETMVKQKVRRGAIIDLDTGELVKDLELTNATLDKIISGKDEEAKKASKLHVETIKELDEKFDNRKERNKFFNESFDRYKKETKVTDADFQRKDPERFAKNLNEKIITEYLPEYEETKNNTVPKIDYLEINSKITICTKKYMDKRSEPCNNFYTKISISNEEGFSYAYSVSKLIEEQYLLSGLNVVLECFNSEVLNDYLEYKNRREK